MKRTIGWGCALLALAAAPVAAQAPAPVCPDCGVVQEVREVEIKGEGTGVGAVVGGVTGAVIGRQFGSGSGRDIMTIAGAAGGAVAGHQVEKHLRSGKRWDVHVRMADGTTRIVAEDRTPSWRPGDRVRIVDGKLEPDR